tara:strand:+ start:1218 stop:1385 length:168 start_codon:yes stop_codon:yes gene_type:complete
MYDDEHPLEIALAWTLSGIAFSIFIFSKLGAFNPENNGIQDLPLFQYEDIDFNSE